MTDRPRAGVRELRWLGRHFRLLASLALLALVFLNVDLESAMALVAAAHPADLALALMATLAMVFLWSIRWWLLATACGLPVSLAEVVSAYWIGVFVGSFLPTTVGSDVVRGAALAYGGRPVPPVVGSILADRLAGLFGLAVLAALGSVWLPPTAYRPVLRIVVALLVAGGFLLMLLLVCGPTALPWLRGRLGGRARWILEGRFPQHVWSASESLVANRWRVVFAFAVSIPLQCILVLIAHLIALSLDLRVPLTVMLAVVPLTSIVSLLPVSVNAIGVQDSAYVFFFQASGVSAEAALSFSVLWHVVRTIVSLGGSLPLMLGTFRVPADIR